MKRNLTIGTTILVLLVALGIAQSVLDRTAATERSVQAPRFEDLVQPVARRHTSTVALRI